jgi:hypothetical protein
MRLVALSLALVAACQTKPQLGPPPKKVVPLPAVVKGANLRPVGDRRRGYGTSSARQTMERLASLGVNTIGILMEGRMNDLADREVLAPPKQEQEAIAEALLDANELGLATVLVPHIYLSDGMWRGEILLPEAKWRDEWWRSYFAFMDVAAQIAASGGASMLSIGVELKGLSQDDDTHDRMQELARRVRRDYSGLLTYSANWDEAEQVAFWDVVDVVGVNGYYPLEPEPHRGAEKIARRLSRLALETERPVVVIEVGYRSSPLSHLRPWEWTDAIDPAVDEAAQANAWAAVLTHWFGATGVRGLMVWMVPTDPDDPASEPRHGFNPLNKPAEQVISRVYSSR